eukprot:TRINITY_DN6151_c0_g1_i1.p1 TRINITY_DN6151_c0_g1~~TRINITY_DN6151_c0_g1_i1.p1  ORF type:complete len:196 (-),score=61.02 TRINITY_DN6151_c0_g1_i1:931-1452(-)
MNLQSPKTKSEPFNSHLLLTDQEILELGIRGCDVELYRRRHYTASFGIDTWYSNLSHLSFKSTSIPLSFNQAKAILSLHLKLRSVSSSNSSNASTSNSNAMLNPLFTTSSNSINSLYNSPSFSNNNNANGDHQISNAFLSNSSSNSVENLQFPPSLLQVSISILFECVLMLYF